jgi:deoxyribose-phosphate aldolase
MTVTELAKFIDHAVLKPNATWADVEAGIAIARKWNIAAFCARPCDVALTRRALADTRIKTGATVGFPHGVTSTAAKVAEARQAVDDGASELDMVMNIPWLLAGDYAAVGADIAPITKQGRPVKVILETGYFTDEQIVTACKIARDAGAAFVKTSTGFGPRGASVHDIELMCKAVGDTMGIKASGGIRNLADALALVAAGATRLGTSSTETILSELQSQGHVS